MVDYISHHGIEGQKWGVRNGPPYPLDPAKDIGHKPNKKELARYTRSLSDEQLNAANKRLQAEQNYIKNTYSQTKGEKVANFLLKQFGNMTTSVIDSASKKMGEKIAQKIVDSAWSNIDKKGS